MSLVSHSRATNKRYIIKCIRNISILGDMLVCGLENGTLWMLHPITLEPIDKNPYKHSMQSIHKLAFSDCGEYLAYAVNKHMMIDIHS